MNRTQIYREFLPKLITRLLVAGLPAAALFLVFWYVLDGYTVWCYILDTIFSATSFLFDISLDLDGGLDGGAFFLSFEQEGLALEIGYKINNHSPNMVVLVLLLFGWPHKNFASFIKLALWCGFFLICYQVLSTWAQLYYTSISPAFADRNKLFWEPSPWFTFFNRLVGFDKFILRYYAAFPIFGLALVSRLLLVRPPKQK